MSFLVVTIIDDPDLCPEVLDAWKAIGVSGATVFESTGMGRMMRSGLREDFPLIPSLEDFLSEREEPHRTMMSVVKDEATVERMVEAAQRIVGNFNLPNTGICFVVPVVKAYGLDRI
ncbi:MAG: P-II family nitrogen regulator [Chloroflexota bacterium]